MQISQSAKASWSLAEVVPSLLNRPTGHPTHDVRPAVAWYVPEGQVMHELDASVVVSPYVPEGQSVHVVVPESRYWPRTHRTGGAEQAVHPVVDHEKLHPEVVPVHVSQDDCPLSG